MHFGNPQILWLLLAWPLLALLGWRALAWRARVARRIGRQQLVERLYPESVRRWRRRRLTLALAAVLLLIVAAARPQYGQVVQTVRSAGSNVLIALDCSKSMTATDIAPTRLDAAKRSLELLLKRLAGDRAGIVAFAGAAFLQCPMTLDHSMAALVLRSLGTDSVGTPGTDIGEAIRVATEAFERGASEGGRSLVLLTDGEDNEGKGIAAAREAAKKQVRIYAIGLGTTRGAPLMDESGSFKEDPSGAKVNTQLRMDTLRKIAEATGGAAIEAGQSFAPAVESVARLIEAQQKVEFDQQRQVMYQDRFQWFLLPALLLILWMLLLRPEPVHLEQRQAELAAPTRA